MTKVIVRKKRAVRKGLLFFLGQSGPLGSILISFAKTKKPRANIDARRTRGKTDSQLSVSSCSELEKTAAEVTKQIAMTRKMPCSVLARLGKPNS
jgi:hypothetical protein